MTTHSKIVDLTRQSPTEETEQLNPRTFPASEDPFLQAAAPTTDAYEVTETYDEPPARSWTRFIVPTMLLGTFMVWTGFFASTFFAEALQGIPKERVAGLISFWAMPTILLAILWLLSMRNSHREAARFRDVANILRVESELLATRMRTVNEEISLAREFLARNSRELETIGRQSSSKLMEAAQSLTAALADSDDKAKTLEAVSNAANTNLDQLRKHLPVVTSAAKDVTNQIGSAGNNAQLQIKSMIAALQRVGEAGKVAKDELTNIEQRGNEVAGHLEQVIADSANLLEKSSEAANVRASEMARVIATSADNLTAKVTQASSDLDTAMARSKAHAEEQLHGLRAALAELSGQSIEERERISAIIAEISGHIESSAQRIAEVDKSATDQTAKLAFAVSALGESTRDVGAALDDNRRIAEQLIDRSEHLLTTLGRANQDIGETLPAAADRFEQRFAQSLEQLNAAMANATDLDALGDGLLLKLRSLEHLIEVQKTNVDQLLGTSEDHFAARQDQVERLAKSLAQTRQLIDELSDDASTKLVASLNHIQEATNEAAEGSRRVLDEEVANIAERLSEQSRVALSGAIDSQIASMNEVIQASIDRNITLSEAATERLTAQLAQLDEMTGNLEARIADSKEQFDNIDDDSFARRMVMLTESLNSTSIDVAKILSNEVTDTAWAAYLKGDRGVFTRRAVRLLDAGEARAIAAHYSDDAEFREHVNRYIHDFEAMMRVLLSTRDGNAIGVTLLSSDVGKLYVALAQAIERLRN